MPWMCRCHAAHPGVSKGGGGGGFAGGVILPEPSSSDSLGIKTLRGRAKGKCLCCGNSCSKGSKGFGMFMFMFHVSKA